MRARLARPSACAAQMLAAQARKCSAQSVVAACFFLVFLCVLMMDVCFGLRRVSNTHHQKPKNTLTKGKAVALFGVHQQLVDKDDDDRGRHVEPPRRRVDGARRRRAGGSAAIGAADGNSCFACHFFCCCCWRQCSQCAECWGRWGTQRFKKAGTPSGRRAGVAATTLRAFGSGRGPWRAPNARRAAACGLGFRLGVRKWGGRCCFALAKRAWVCATQSFDSSMS